VRRIILLIIITLLASIATLAQAPPYTIYIPSSGYKYEVPVQQTPTPTSTPSATYTPTSTPLPSLPPGGECIPTHTLQVATTVSVIDGDTIDVNVEGEVYRVRYIGMDTPERWEPFYAEAKAFDRSLVEGKTLYLYKDVSETDRYGRLLRYVVADDVFVNLELVHQGWATVATYPPDVACADAFLTAQQDAQENGRGIWAPTQTPTPTPTAAPTVTPTPTRSRGQARLAISYIQYSGSDEYVKISNTGTASQNMTGWKIQSVVGDQWYSFPLGYRLAAGAYVRVHSGRGAYSSPPTDLLWTRRYIWNNSGDKAVLYKSSGAVVDSSCYGNGCP